MSRRAALRAGLGLALLVLVADQASKWWILEVVRLPLRQHVPLLALGPLGLDLTMVWNRGVTFGLMAGERPWHAALLSGLAAAVAAVLLRWMARAENRRTALALGALVGGAAGNALDRLRFGAVADFVDAHAFGWHWYVFNLADSAIVLGVAVLLWETLRPRPAPEAERGVRRP